MKRFIFCLFILGCFSGFVFWKGWVQYKVAPESCGIVISKTSGISEVPVEAGKFSWYWEFLLPTNAQLKTFNIQPQSMSKTVKFELPGANLYSSAYNNSNGFTYEFDFSIYLTVDSQSLVELYAEKKIIGEDDLKEYLSRAGDTISQLAASYYIKKLEENPDFHPESVRREDLIKSLQLYKEYPQVQILTFALNSYKIPDLRLYKQLQSQALKEPANKIESSIISDNDSKGDMNE